MYGPHLKRQIELEKEVDHLRWKLVAVHIETWNLPLAHFYTPFYKIFPDGGQSSHLRICYRATRGIFGSSNINASGN